MVIRPSYTCYNVHINCYMLINIFVDFYYFIKTVYHSCVNDRYIYNCDSTARPLMIIMEIYDRLNFL